MERNKLGQLQKGHKPLFKNTGKDHHNYRHGMTGTPIYKKWEAMKRRCYNKNEKSYSNYGGRGIKVCDRWLDFFKFWNDMGNCVKGESLERIDNNGNYCKENCIWIPMALQAKNKRSVILYEFDGKKLCLADWSRLLKIPRATLRARIKEYKWSIEEALTTPVDYGNKYNRVKKDNS